MREIGGYFGLERFSGCEYHHDLVGVNSGRNALLYVLKARRYRKIYIPRFLCDSVSELCRREGYAYEEYPMGADFQPQFSGEIKPDEAIYVVNFYGQVSDEDILRLEAQYGNVIFDNVQDFFRKPVDGVDTVYSCRKFFGVPDGGYVSCTGVVLPLPEDESRERMTHILGRFEVSGSRFYGDFQKNDELFYEMPLRAMSPLTKNILRGVDYDSVRAARNENYGYLSAALGELNGIRPVAPDGPYAYPFYCENGMELKRKLAEAKIYVATLWPNVRQYDGTLEKDYAENILPLPIDQRYGRDDMIRVIEAVKSQI